MILHYAHNFHFFFTFYNQFSLTKRLELATGISWPTFSMNAILAYKYHFLLFCFRNQDGQNERRGRRSMISEIYFRYTVQVMSSILLKSISK